MIVGGDAEVDAVDAVADIVIFLADYCSARGFDLESLVSETWAEVRKRDWKANSETAQAQTSTHEGG